MAWITPVTNWIATDYINYEDWNRMESNNVELLDTVTLIYGSAPLVDTPVTDRFYSRTFNYVADINRIESTIKAIKDFTLEPIGWVTPKTDWIADSDTLLFSDVNRIETNQLLLYNLLSGTIDSVLKTGDTNAITGQNATYL